VDGLTKAYKIDKYDNEIFLYYIYPGKMLSKIKLQNQEVVRQAAASLSASLPKRIDAYTQLTAITPKGQTLQYTFALKTLQSDALILKRADETMIPRIKRNICRSNRRFIESDITIRYSYIRSKSSKPLFSVDVNRTVCDYPPE